MRNWAARRFASSSARDIYQVNPPGVTDLQQIAASPAYDRLFRDSRFTTYILTTYSRGAMESDWADGFTAAEYDAERDEIRRLGEYLLGNPAFAGKTFIILNWEGDNAIGGLSKKRSVWDYYRDWIEARADGVRDARAAASEAKLYSGLEFNFIRSPRTGQMCGSPVADPVNQDALANRCVIDYVAPQVSVDYYSYSAWQTLERIEPDPGLGLASELRADLRTVVAMVKAARPEVGESDFFIGEFGFERARYGECRTGVLMREVFEALEGEGGLEIPYAIYWQILDNFPLYAALDERFGLFRASGSGIGMTRAGTVFRRAISGEAGPSDPPCPAIRRPGTAWVYVTDANGLESNAQGIALECPDCPSINNTCSILERAYGTEALLPGTPISIFGSFPTQGNRVFIEQRGPGLIVQRTEIARNGDWSESAARIDVTLPTDLVVDREALVTVIDAAGRSSNARAISISRGCTECGPAMRFCRAILNGESERFHPGTIASIHGRFLTDDNRVIIEQWDEAGNPTRHTLGPDSRGWQELETRIDVGLPADLWPGRALIYVVDSAGRESEAREITITATTMAVVSAAS